MHGNHTETHIFTAEQTNASIINLSIINLSNILLNRHINHVMEIGFDAGFSAVLMLLTNPTIKLTCIDIGEHPYTLPCYEKIKETFGDRITLLIGDSNIVLPQLSQTFDVIHIDGHRVYHVAENDIINSCKLSRVGTVLIMNGYNLPWIHHLWNIYIRYRNFKPLNSITYNNDIHDARMMS